jgi:hypothetical protein
MKLPGYLPILLLTYLVGLSCADIASPSRSNAYEWRRITSTGPGSADTLSFRWPSSRLPVRVWAQDSLNLVTDVENGLAEWESAFIHGEFRAVLVPDSNSADVIVRVGSAVKGGFLVMRLRAGLAPECEGGTDFDLPAGSTQLALPIRVFVNPRFDPAEPGVAECMALTTTHELGHVIGILAHSPDPADIMFGDPSVTGLSESDRSTAEVAYHTEANLTPGPR